MRVAKYDKVFHPDNTEQQKAFPRRLPLITSWAIPFEPGGRHGQRRGHPATSPSGSTVDECRHLGPVVPDVPGPHPVEMAGIARENVSRILNDWMRQKLLSRLAGYYCLEDRAALEREVAM